jgi:hypothetical protein
MAKKPTNWDEREKKLKEQLAKIATRKQIAALQAQLKKK